MAHMVGRHKRMGMLHQHKGKILGSTEKCMEELTAKIVVLDMVLEVQMESWLTIEKR